MGRTKLTISLSGKCLQLIDSLAETTGFESRSRVIEESIFALTELLGYRRIYGQQIQQMQPRPSQEELMSMLFKFSDMLSKFGGILDRFERFPDVQRNPSIKYRAVPREERNEKQIQK